jgi:hypothetical protein
LFVSCKKNKNEDDPNSLEHQVYVAGSINDRSVYWKNGVVNNLDTGNYLGYSYGVCIYVTNNDVYVCGGKEDNNELHAIYWKNGVATFLKKDSESRATSIITSGSDVYVTGNIYDRTNDNTKAVYWKNGQIFYLSQDTSFASDVAISGTDVYITGYKTINGIHRATLWKNGIAIELADSTIDCYASKIFVSGNDIYIGGTKKINNQPMAIYWKNGAINYTNGQFYVNSIYVSGSDVYLTGGNIYAYNQLDANFYWKNGTATKLSGFQDVVSIYVYGSDVYLAGIGFEQGYSYNGNYGVLWKNGKFVPLTPKSLEASYAYSVFVK